MTTELCTDASTADQAQDEEVRSYRGFWWVLGYRQPKESIPVCPQVSSPGRQSLAGRKRLNWASRLLRSLLPRWLQSFLGYPVSTNIGRCLSPEVSISPTKPCGKGSKRKQDELDEDDDEDEEEHQTWVEALTQEYTDDGQEEDPDYEPSTVETASEEYCTHNDTEDDFEVKKGVVVIEDVDAEVTDAQSPAV